MSYYNQDQLITLENQKAALLEALEELMNCSAIFHDGGGIEIIAYKENIDKARAAIKLARGE